tara:strand:- start:1306 stop:1848 length:543 start_codon:yes stop_codon:yes gene_type:complete
MTPEQIKAVNKTARSSGAVGINAIVPRIVGEFADIDAAILDYGAGPKAIHTLALRDKGFVNVTAYDIGDNVRIFHNCHALKSEYDVIFASNVINILPDRNALTDMFGEIARILKEGGVFIFNYPKEPDKLNMSYDWVLDMLKLLFPMTERHIENGTMIFSGSGRHPRFTQYRLYQLYKGS